MKTVNVFVRHYWEENFSARVVVDINTDKETTIFIPFQTYNPIRGISAITDACVRAQLMPPGLFIHTYCHENGIDYFYKSEKCGKAEAIRWGQK